MKHHRKKGLFVVILLVLATTVLLIGSAAGAVESANELALAASAEAITWTHLSTANGDLDPPSGSTQQTAALVFDINKDGLNDLVVGARRSPGPSMVWYKRQANGWQRYVIDDDVLKIEAGGAYHDIDNDGDVDIVMGGDAGANEIWWWENPYPNYNPSTNWTRHLVKNSGDNQHHDQMFGDFDDDGQIELAFWNQGGGKLYLAEIPSNPRNSNSWTKRSIYSWSSGVREGLAQADIDGDGIVDIIGGGRWFKLNGNGSFTANTIDGAQSAGRAAAGQLVKGGRSEVVFVEGDGTGPLKWYEWDGSNWNGTALLTSNVDHGHSLQIEDIDEDGNLDIFVAEMRVDGGNSNAKMWIFLGNGSGNFTKTEVATGFGNHESKLADLDGDGDLDIFGKPFNWNTPRLDIWLNESSGGSCEPSLDQWDRHLIDSSRPERAIFIYPADLNGDGLQDVAAGAWWYKNPGSPSGSWSRKTIGSPLNNVAAVYDFDNDGDIDILGTEGIGSAGNDDFVWARNNGSGSFTIFNNIDAADGDFLQGVAVDEFVSGNTEVALSWHRDGEGIQILDVPDDPRNDTWSWRRISSTSLDEGLSSGDIDRDGDRDLLLGTKWLRNDAEAGSGSDWAISSRPYRVRATVDMNGTIRNDKPAEFSVNFTELLASVGASGAFDPNSLRVVGIDENNGVLNNNVPFQFDPDVSYDENTNAVGTMIVLMADQRQANAVVYYHIYFDSLNGQPATPVNVTPQVVLSDGVSDEGQASYKIETNTATYYYHKNGGGFSSLVDGNGNDWINHSSDSGSAGDFRGIPNLVHPNDGGYFHPGRDSVTSSVLSQGPLKATFSSKTPDNKWETMWEIFPNYARLTVLKADTNYWFLYEGTPGGLLETGSDFVVRSNGTQTLLSESWTDDLTNPEWLFFSDPNVNRSLYFVHHENDSIVDSYYPMENAMTVFGFGRDGNSRNLTQVPSHFTLGFADQTDASTVESALDNAYQPLAISLGTAEQQTAASSSGPWSVKNLFNGGGDPDRNRLIDMNGDGRLDAVIGYEAISTEGTLAWYKQPSNATSLWTERVIADDVIGPMSLDVADMDGDGDIDVVVGEHDTSNNGTPRMLLYENPGTETGTWTAHTVHTGDEHHDGAQLVDIDNDGDLDIVSIGWTHNDVLLYENTGCASGGGQATATPSNPDPTATSSGPTATPAPPTATSAPSGDAAAVFVSSSTGGTAGNVAFVDEDIIRYDASTGAWSVFLDGSDVGLSGSASRDIDAFHVLEDDSVLFSVIGATSLPDVGSVDDSDIIHFQPTSMGNNTAGSFSLYFDGSDVALDADSEDIDALTLLDNGDLLISTLGTWNVGSLSGEDEDLLRFRPTSLYNNTAGSWSMHFDGSDVGLNNSGDEDTWGAWADSNGGAVYLTTKSSFSVPGLNGDGADVIKCQPGSLGNNTSCSFQLEWDGSANGVAGEYLDGISLRSGTGGDPSPTNTPAAQPTNTPVAPTPTPGPGGSDEAIYVSSNSGGNAGGVSFGDEDILEFDPASGTWTMLFDGSDVGLSSSSAQDINAFDILGDGSILLSTVGDTTVPDVGTVNDSDIVRFVPTSLGSNTAGTFSLYFDGSDLGLTTTSDDIDSIASLNGGDLLISLAGGSTAAGFSSKDEDILRFTPTRLGSNTAGSWSLYFDGSDVGLNDSSNEDIWGAWVDDASGAIHFTTMGTFSVNGASGDGADISKCQPISLGDNTNCSFQLIWDGSTNGFGGELVDGISMQSVAVGNGGGWANRDIGNVGIPGSLSVNGGTFTVVASGSDIWGTKDQFHYVYQSLNGDGEIIAKVVSQTQSHAWAKAGVMIRESLDSNSRNALALISADNGVRMQWRASTGGTSTIGNGGSGSAPIWLRLVRSGNQFEAYRSDDGVNWGTPFRTKSLTMAQNVYVGLAVTAHNNSKTSQVVFSDVQVLD